MDKRTGQGGPAFSVTRPSSYKSKLKGRGRAQPRNVQRKYLSWQMRWQTARVSGERMGRLVVIARCCKDVDVHRALPSTPPYA